MLRIIKARSPTAPTDERPAAAPFVDVTASVQTRLQAAEAEADRLIADARAAVDRLRREAEHQGLEAASATARQRLCEELTRRLDTALPALERAADGLRQATTQHLAACERHVVRLALGIAERVIRREVQRVPDIPLALIREALELAASSPRVALHVHPADHETLQTHWRSLAASRTGGRQLELVADPDIEPGGCVVRTDFGVIDQQFSTQLARIEEELT